MLEIVNKKTGEVIIFPTPSGEGKQVKIDELQPSDVRHFKLLHWFMSKFQKKTYIPKGIDFSDTSELIDKISAMLHEDDMEVCSLCGQKTDVPRNQDIALRKTYVEGAGQLCGTCYDKLYNTKLP